MLAGNGLFSPLSVAQFLACDVPSAEEAPFFRETLPSHLDTHYLLGFLLTLHQRFTLASLSDQVAEGWDSGSGEETDDTSSRRKNFFARFAISYSRSQQGANLSRLCNVSTIIAAT